MHPDKIEIINHLREEHYKQFSIYRKDAFRYCAEQLVYNFDNNIRRVLGTGE